MESLRESISVMLQQETKFTTSIRSVQEFAWCECLETHRALHLLHECAMLVTDPSCLQSKLVSRSPSIVSVRDLPDTTVDKLLDSSLVCCHLCQKPLQQQQAPLQPALQAWREQMFEWACRIVDGSEVADRTGVLALCFSILDRYYNDQQRKQSITKDDYQLTSMTSMFLAMKFLEGRVMDVDSMMAMSHGLFTAQDFVTRESDILKALEWRLASPPTAIVYCRSMLTAFSKKRRAALESRCATLTEIIILDFAFSSSYDSSVIALACMVLAARLLNISEDTIQSFITSVDDLFQSKDCDFQRVYQHLERVYCQ